MQRSKQRRIRKTVDPETGITLSEVMQEAVDQEVALADLEAGESITFDMPMMLASGETGTKSVTVTAGSWYYYADYGLGSYLTCPYYVKWGSINATAYCVEPSKKRTGKWNLYDPETCRWKDTCKGLLLRNKSK